jgi:hypothetical protein
VLYGLRFLILSGGLIDRGLNRLCGFLFHDAPPGQPYCCEVDDGDTLEGLSLTFIAQRNHIAVINRAFSFHAAQKTCSGVIPFVSIGVSGSGWGRRSIRRIIVSGKNATAPWYRIRAGSAADGAIFSAPPGWQAETQ